MLATRKICVLLFGSKKAGDVCKREKMLMTLPEFEREFRAILGTNYKTKDVDRFNKRFIKEDIAVSFLRPVLLEHEEYYRTYFQVSIMQLKSKEKKMAFVEDNFDLLHDWWHVDGIVSFLGDSLDFDYALSKAKEYINSELPYVRRLGYVLFIPRLVRDAKRMESLFELFKDDDAYHVVMGEAWLLSYLAMCDADRTYAYLQGCDLKYNIVGKAIQKICDSYVVSVENKERFKGLRASRKKFHI